MGRLKRAWLWFLAYFRLSSRAVCEMSKGRERWNDFHSYPDSPEGFPDHCVVLTCKRCGKEFVI